MVDRVAPSRDDKANRRRRKLKRTRMPERYLPLRDLTLASRGSPAHRQPFFPSSSSAERRDPPKIQDCETRATRSAKSVEPLSFMGESAAALCLEKNHDRIQALFSHPFASALQVPSGFSKKLRSASVPGFPAARGVRRGIARRLRRPRRGGRSSGRCSCAGRRRFRCPR